MKKPWQQKQKKVKGKKNVPQPNQEIIRVRTPRDKEVLGVINRRLGGSRMDVACLDAKNRICRIPGKLKNKLWIREGDIVLVKPWEYEHETKGDVIYKYRPNQIDWLKKRGFLDKLADIEEF